MRFQNAVKGLKFVLSSELLELFALIFFSVIATLQGVPEFVLFIVVFLCIVALVAALIFTLKGLKMARKDEEAFNTAYDLNLVMLIMEIVFMVISLFGSKIPFLKGLTQSSSVSIVFSFVASISIIMAIQNLFKSAGDEKNASFAHTVMLTTVINAGLDLVIALLCVITINANTTSAMAIAITILLVLFLAFSIVTYAMYLALLSKAIHKLA